MTTDAFDALDPAQLDPRIATGNTAGVFTLDDERVLKLFSSGGTEAVRREAEATRIAHAAGLPVPAVHALVAVDGRPGLVFERVDEGTVLEAVGTRPWTVHRWAHRIADCHARIHACSGNGLPSLTDRLAENVETADLPPASREAALAVLDEQPTSDALCHGDFHPGNVLRTASGPTVIDWIDARSGPPAADVARTDVLLRFAPAPDGFLEATAVRLFRELIRRWYLRRYLQQTAVSRAAVRAWRLPVAAARLTEDVSETGALRSFVITQTP